MSVSRAQFKGSHLENAAQDLLEIEAMMSGGWRAHLLPKVRAPQRLPANLEGREFKGASPGSGGGRGVPRVVRIAEPRRAPVPVSNERHHHFEQKTILASGRDAASVAVGRAAYGEGRNVEKLSAGDQSKVTNEAAYGEGVRSTEAERVVFVTGTTGSTTSERLEFWRLADANAHFVGQHRITVTTKGVEQLWDDATKNPTMPKELRDTVAAARSSADGCASLVVNDAGVVKRWMKARKRSFPAALAAHVETLAPHNGRVAYSIIGQFPHDMSINGMQRCLKMLVNEYTDRNIPCQAVIHEPTKKNATKNWHFHLMVYAGEAERLADGRWSFERVLERDRYRTMKSVPLKRLPKSTDMAAVDWIPSIKRRWSEIVNEQAAMEGIATRFVNETNKQRGLQKPQTRVTMGRQALHKQGFFTDSEVADNLASWKEWRDRQIDTIKARYVDVADLAFRTRQHIGNFRKTTPRDKVLQANSDLLEDAIVSIDGHIYNGAQAAMLHGAMSSGPQAIRDYYGGKRDDLGRKPVTKKRQAEQNHCEEFCGAAIGYTDLIAPALNKLLQIQLGSIIKLNEIADEIETLSSLIATRIHDLVERIPSVLPKMADIADPDKNVTGSMFAEGSQHLPTVSDKGLNGVNDVSMTNEAAGDNDQSDEKQRKLERLFRALIDQRVLSEKRGVERVIDKELLLRFQVEEDWIRHRDAQSRLKEIYSDHHVELAPLVVYVENNPGELVKDQYGWTLGEEAPFDIWKLCQTWSHSDLLQKRLGELAVAHAMLQDQVISSPPSVLAASLGPIMTGDTSNISVDLDGNGLLAAARLREKLSQKWVAHETFKENYVDTRSEERNVPSYKNANNHQLAHRLAHINSGQSR